MLEAERKGKRLAKAAPHGRRAEDVLTIDAVIPCFRVSKQAPSVVRYCLEQQHVRNVVVVDDACPEETGNRIREAFANEPRVVVLEHSKNSGVGGAVLTGFAYAFSHGADVAVKVDGDGQMDPATIHQLVRPIVRRKADYTKGNRFFYRKDLTGMPRVRLVGNAMLSLVNKFSSGYWSIMDPTNGFVALHRVAYAKLDTSALDKRFFFESDMLFQLGVANAVVVDVPLPAFYGDESSSLSVFKALLQFPAKYLVRFLKRIAFKYFVREFNIASLEIMFGVPLLFAGLIFGAYEWTRHYRIGEVTPAGTVMIVGLLIIIGFQLLISVLNYDISHEPMTPLLERDGEPVEPGRREC